MSYSLIYNRCFIKLSNDEYIPFLEMGDNNVYQGKKRARDWQIWPYFNKDRGYITTEKDTINKIEKWKKEKIEYIINSKKRDRINISAEEAEKELNKSFFYWASLKLQYGNSFTSFKNYYVNGFKKSFTFNELKEKNISIHIYSESSYYESIKKEYTENNKKQHDIYVNNEKNFKRVIKAFKNYYKDTSILYFVHLNISNWQLKELKEKYKKQEQKREKQLKTFNHYYIAVTKKGYFYKFTKYGYKYTSINNYLIKKFITEKQAQKVIEKLKNKGAS